MNDFRLDRGYVTVTVGQAFAADRADGKYVRLTVQDEAFDNETAVTLTPDEALLIAAALRQRAGGVHLRSGRESSRRHQFILF